MTHLAARGSRPLAWKRSESQNQHDCMSELLSKLPSGVMRNIGAVRWIAPQSSEFLPVVITDELCLALFLRFD